MPLAPPPKISHLPKQHSLLKTEQATHSLWGTFHIQSLALSPQSTGTLLIYRSDP